MRTLLLLLVATSAAAQDFFLEPAHGSPAGGEAIRLIMTVPAIDFLSGVPAVFFADIPATVSVIDSKTLRVVTPPHQEAAVGVEVHFAGVTYTSQYKFGYVVPRGAILIPLAIETPGAYGTHWTTDVWAYNDTDDAVNLLPEVCFGFTQPYPCDTSLVAPAHGSIRVPLNSYFSDLAVHKYLYPPNDIRSHIHFSARVRNAADPDDVGAEIPVVPISQFRHERLVLVNVPVNDRYRSLLWIYDQEEGSAPQPVFVRVYDAASNELLASRETGWKYPTPADSVLRFSFPIYDLLDDAGVRGHSVVRLEIEEADASIWGMLMLTDKRTQHVTVITSQ